MSIADQNRAAELERRVAALEQRLAIVESMAESLHRESALDMPVPERRGPGRPPKRLA